MIPVNPGLEGQELFEETVYSSLADIPLRIAMVDVFRRVDAIPGIVDELLPLAVAKGIRYLWLQLDIYDKDSATRARDAGLTVVMDRCPKIEWGRLHSELSWGGFNSGIVSSRRRRYSSA